MISDRIRMVFKAMIDALLGKVEDPQMMLENTYAELHLALTSGRQKLANLLAIETEIKTKIQTLEKVEAQVKEAVVSGGESESELGQLKEKLRRVQHEIAELKRILSELEDNVRKAYTRKQVLIARDKAGRATLVTDEILVGKAITEVGTTWDREIHSVSTVDEEAARKLALSELGGGEPPSFWLTIAFLISAVVVGYLMFH